MITASLFFFHSRKKFMNGLFFKEREKENICRSIESAVSSERVVEIEKSFFIYFFFEKAN